MNATSNETLNNQSHCSICLEGLAVRTNVTLSCCHTFHLDCIGSAFNAVNAMRCSVCRAIEDGVWQTFPTRAPWSSRAAAHANQEDEQGPPVQLQPPLGTHLYPDQRLPNGHLPLENGGIIRDFPPPVHAMMPAATPVDRPSPSAAATPMYDTTPPANGRSRL